MKIFGCYLCRSHQIILEDCRAAFSTGENCGSSIWRAELSAAPVAARITHISMTFDHHAVLQLAAPLPAGERSDRACAIRVRGAGSMTVCDPLTRNVRARRAHSDLSPAGRGKPRLPYRQRNTHLGRSQWEIGRAATPSTTPRCGPRTDPGFSEHSVRRAP